MARGRSEFSGDEISKIRALISQKQGKDKQAQLTLRNELRELGFYISDFGHFGRDGITAADLDGLISSGRITVAR